MKEDKLLRALDKAIFLNQKESLGADSIIPGGSLSVERCLEISRTGVLSSLQEVISSSYSETIEKARSKYGEEVINKYILDYCSANPSKEYNIMNYGASFSRYLITLDSYIAEYARFEFLMQQLQFNSSELALMSHSFNIDVHKFKTADFVIEHFEIDVENDDLVGESALLLYLRDGSAHYYHLNESEFAFFAALENQGLVEKWFDESDLSPEEIQSMFVSLSGNKIVMPVIDE